MLGRCVASRKVHEAEDEAGSNAYLWEVYS